MLYAGHYPHYKFRFYYFGREAACIGANNGTAQSSPKYDYKDDIRVEDSAVLVSARRWTALPSAVNKASHILVTQNFASRPDLPVESATLAVDPGLREPKSKVYRPANVEALLKMHDLDKKGRDTDENRVNGVRFGLYCSFTMGCKTYHCCPSRPWSFSERAGDRVICGPLVMSQRLIRVSPSTTFAKKPA
jgi:hypothetical protein